MPLGERNTIRKVDSMIQLFFIALLTISVLSGLTVEAIKKMFKGYKVSWHANILSAIVSAVLSVAVSAGYIVYTGTALTAQLIVLIIALIFLSWLCSMVGYDKVTQAIAQIKSGKGGN